MVGSLGYAYEQQADYASAVSYFKQLSSAADAIMRGDALYHLGWLYDKLGQTDKSTEAYNKIISDHPDFMYIDLVKERMSSWLEDKKGVRSIFRSDIQIVLFNFLIQSAFADPEHSRRMGLHIVCHF